MHSIPLLLAPLLLMKGVLVQKWNVNYDDYYPNAKDGTDIMFRCSFTLPNGQEIRRGMWKKNLVDFVYHIDQTLIERRFRGRTKYLGDETSNCSLLITDLRIEDSGSYQFIAMVGEKFLNGPKLLLKVTENLCWAKLHYPNVFEEGKKATVACAVRIASGQIPYWYNSDLTYIQSQNVSRSETNTTLSLIPSRNDNGKILLCWRTGCPVEELKMNVWYRPDGVQLNSTADSKSPLETGQNVSLRCEISSSNPPVTQYSWYKDGIELLKPTQNHFFLESITTSDSGSYRCAAHNKFGFSASVPVSIQVVCSSCGSTVSARPSVLGVVAVAVVFGLLIIGIITCLCIRRNRRKAVTSTRIGSSIHDIVTTPTLALPGSQIQEVIVPEKNLSTYKLHSQ